MEIMGLDRTKYPVPAGKAISMAIRMAEPKFLAVSSLSCLAIALAMAGTMEMASAAISVCGRLYIVNALPLYMPNSSLASDRL